MLLKEYKEIMEELSNIKITNTYLAKLLGTSPQNISKRIKNKSVLTTLELSILENTTGIYSADETSNTRVKNYMKGYDAATKEAEKRVVKIKYRPNVYLSAGYGLEVYDEQAETMVLDEWLFITDKGTRINPDNCEIVAISGNSMSPEYRHGDRVILDKSVKNWIDGHIFAFRLNGECFVKEICLLGKRVKAIPLNKEYEPFFIEETDDVEILGRVVPRVRL